MNVPIKIDDLGVVIANTDGPLANVVFIAEPMGGLRVACGLSTDHSTAICFVAASALVAVLVAANPELDEAAIRYALADAFSVADNDEVVEGLLAVAYGADSEKLDGTEDIPF